MSKSEIVNFCSRRKRLFSQRLYNILGVWTVLLIFLNVMLRISVVIQERTYEGSQSLQPNNVFAKWYQANRRSLLEEESDRGDGSILTSYRSNNRTANLTNVEDISRYFGSQDFKKLEKVFSMLDSFIFRRNPNVPDMDCPAILRGEQDQILHAKLANLELHSTAFEGKKANLIPSDEKVVNLAKNCQKFKKRRQYFTISLSKEENAYPIAYIITIHRDLQSFERLLRSIYHPQNLYCVHVDPKSTRDFMSAVATVTGCFDNVFIPSKLTEVFYSHWSRVQADLNCMQSLVAKKEEFPWKYVINLCGQDFPIKTNLEIVRTLKNLQGFNNLETFKTPSHKKKRYELHFELPKSPKHDHSLMKKTDTKKDPPPNGIEMFSGGAYYIFKRQAVEFMLSDLTIKKFFKWNEDTYSPDEHLWATLQRMFPQLPGSFPPHEKYDLNELQALTRIIKWGGLDEKVYPRCEGRFVRGVCVLGCGDLAWLVTQHHLFANKFDAEMDVLALECLDNWIRNRTIDNARKYFARGFL